VLVSALSIAVHNRFPKGTPREDISAYAASLKSRYPDAEQDVKPIVVEALIRTMLGEPNLLEGISNNDLVPLEFVVVHDIMSQQDLSGARMDEYVDQVIATANAS
jgi:hypothetical protein